MTRSDVGLIGWGEAVLFDVDGHVKARCEFRNLVTSVGDQYYGERAAGVASPPAQVTGMKLGTASTAVAKTGAGAGLVTYLSDSQQALSGTPTSTQPGGAGTARVITFQAIWAAGKANSPATPITEVVIVNETLTDALGAQASATIARALLTGISSKGASDTLTVTWNHSILGA
jgi:hypothetical protein